MIAVILNYTLSYVHVYSAVSSEFRIENCGVDTISLNANSVAYVLNVLFFMHFAIAC